MEILLDDWMWVYNQSIYWSVSFSDYQSDYWKVLGLSYMNRSI